MKDDIREKALERTREQLKEPVDRDRFMIKAVKFLDNLDQDLNSDMERLRDWYSLHFPELEQEIEDDRELIRVLSDSVSREELESFEEMAADSTGAPLTGDDLEMLEKTVAMVDGRYDYREELEEYVTETAKETMPNLSVLLEPLLAAKLVALAGSLEELAKSPASTIQMLGAEKALFRYMRGEGTPPKHGIVFQHRFVHSLPESERGKMARFIANKAAMAARLDFYGDKEKGEELHAEIQETYQALKD